VDTCCIDKKNLVELSKAITSMFRWYRDAVKCYVYLSDVIVGNGKHVNGSRAVWEPVFRRSRWFTRGWTLQELLAPNTVEIFSHDEHMIGTKQALAPLIHEVTTVPIAALLCTPLDQFPVQEKIRWSKLRTTKETEDGAYCLLGIFGVFMPLIYGEGENAFQRLHDEINRKHGSNVAGSLIPFGGSATLGKRRAQFDDDNNERQEEQRSSKACRIMRNSVVASPSSMSVEYDINGTQPIVPQPQQSEQPAASAIDREHLSVLTKSLRFDRMDFRVNNVKKGILSTCQWLFQHPTFLQWSDNELSAQHSGFLWLKGRPGSGKSTLMKATLDWARRRKSRSKVQRMIIPYFFNARASASLEKSSLGLYRTVVHHLVSSYPALRNLFAERFALKHSGPSDEEWTVEELQGFLHDAVASNEEFHLCLLVDALDEAEFEDDVRDMIGFFIQLSDEALAPHSSCKLQICLSSRHYPHITIQRGLSLVVEEQPEHSQDINVYITNTLSCADGSEKNDLQACILERSSHIFLWVALVVKILNKMNDKGHTMCAMKSRLDSLPPGLNDLFQEILLKSDENIETSVLLFQWMAFRMRPLEPAELFVAMEYSKLTDASTTYPISQIPVPTGDRLSRVVLDCSRGLVEVARVSSDQPAVLQFIHETVREFLLKENGLSSVSKALSASIHGISHNVLRTACDRCVSMNEIPKEYKVYATIQHESVKSLEMFKSEMRLRLPFLDYAVSFLFDHAEEAQKHCVPQRDFLKRQIDREGRFAGKCRLWWNVLQRYKSKKIGPDLTLIYFIVDRYPGLLSEVLEVSRHINTPCGALGTALVAAVDHGHRDAVQLLVHHGADVNLSAQGRASPLEVAVKRGYESIIRSLLDSGDEIDTKKNSVFAERVREAAKAGNESMLLVLLSPRIESTALKRLSGYALVHASFGSQDEVVRLLLGRDVDVNAVDEVRWHRVGSPTGKMTALSAASRCGNLMLVGMLLDNGADVNASELSESPSALCQASSHGHEVVARTLLDHGAKIGTALVRAAGKGHKHVVELLLFYGAEVNASELSESSSPLCQASSHGHEAIARTLLDHGAKIGTALFQAAEKGHKQVVELLLSYGADVNVVLDDVFGRSPLEAASASGYLEIARTLLDSKAEIRNALLEAAFSGREQAVKLLLSYGADVNAKGSVDGFFYGDALAMAAQWDHGNILRALLHAGATNLNSALSWASREGHAGTVRILLDAGATDLGDVLAKASEEGHEQIVRMILDAGCIEIDEALTQAKKYGHESIVKILRERFPATKLLMTRGTRK
jgi:ankyrin repeat protein